MSAVLQREAFFALASRAACEPAPVKECDGQIRRKSSSPLGRVYLTKREYVATQRASSRAVDVRCQQSAISDSKDNDGSPWKTLEGMLWSDTHAKKSQSRKHRSDADRLEDIFKSKSARKPERAKTEEVEELSQQNQALSQLIKGMQLKGGCSARWSPEKSWTSLFTPSNDLELAEIFQWRQQGSRNAAESDASWQESAAANFFDPHPVMTPIPAFQPSSIVRPQFPNPEVKPSLTPGISQPGPAPEFSPFPNQPGTSPNIEVPTIAPGTTEIPTPSELPPSGQPTEVPSITPPSFTPPDLPSREVDIPTRAPPVPLPNTPPITPPGTPEPSPTPQTTPITPPDKPDPSPTPQAPPLSEPQSPPGFPGFSPGPSTAPDTPPRTPGPEIVPPGFGGGFTAFLSGPVKAPRATSWHRERQIVGIPSSRAMLWERRPVRPVVSFDD